MPVNITAFVPVHKFPKAERNNVSDLVSSLNILNMLVDQFTHAVSLHQMVQRSRKAMDHFQANGWSAIAFRDGASLIYEFGMILRKMGDLRRKSPTFNRLHNKDLWDSAGKHFYASFPHFDNLRNAALHAPQILSSTAQRDRHKHVGGLTIGGTKLIETDGRGGSIVGTIMVGNQLVAAAKGSLRSYSLDEKSIAALLRTVLFLNGAFTIDEAKLETRA